MLPAYHRYYLKYRGVLPRREEVRDWAFGFCAVCMGSGLEAQGCLGLGEEGAISSDSLIFLRAYFPITSFFLYNFILVYFHSHSHLFVPSWLDFTWECRLCYGEEYYCWQGWLCRKASYGCTHVSWFPWQLIHIYHPKILCLTWMWQGVDRVPHNKCSRMKRKRVG